MTACYRHPEAEATIQCQRCNRPVCPDCQISAPVGFQCPGCVQEAAARRPVQRTPFGAKVRHGAPVVTYAVIGLCAVLYMLQIAPQFLPQAAGVPNITEQFGYAPLFTAQDHPSYSLEPWRMLTSAVLHSPQSAMHILFNMAALWFVGRVIEPAVGGLRYAVLLLLSAFGGSVAVMYLSDPGTLTVGASGAVFGLFGALFILLRSSGAETGGIVALLAINMAISFMVPNISWQGHLGGLVTGVLVALVIAKAPRRRRPLWHTLGLGGVALLLVVLTAAGIPLVEITRGGGPILGV